MYSESNYINIALKYFNNFVKTIFLIKNRLTIPLKRLRPYSLNLILIFLGGLFMQRLQKFPLYSYLSFTRPRFDFNKLMKMAVWISEASYLSQKLSQAFAYLSCHPLLFGIFFSFRFCAQFVLYFCAVVTSIFFFQKYLSFSRKKLLHIR